MRFTCDTGGTFTDLIVEEDNGQIRMYKTATTPDHPVEGVLDALEVAARDFGLSLESFLKKGDVFIHGTTHAINAIITGKTARTAFLTTAGHPDILVMREGGRAHPFDYTVAYPEPYVPRALTFEIPERVFQDGTIASTLDEDAVLQIIDCLKSKAVEAASVCFLWSTINPAHELRVGELLQEHMPGLAFTLSHQLNPSLREYRRASSAVIDASLKPLMSHYMESLTGHLQGAGFSGKIYVLTSQGGMLSARDLAKTPIHAINSGPSMAPIAGRHYADSGLSEADIFTNVIVADTGGTTYDVSLIRGQKISVSREMWVGEPYVGHMTGFPSIDVKSVGAGGGSIAWVDSGGMLHVGPQSAGSEPGPVCYARGGTLPTLTDACVILGYLDPDYFLGGEMKLNIDGARTAVQTIAEKLNLNLESAAAAIVEIATENMVQAIADITINCGVDPSSAVLIGGGGAAGLNSVKIAQRLGCRKLIIPETGAALSAAGALLTDLSSEYRATLFQNTGNFNFDAAQQILDELTERCHEFTRHVGAAENEINYAIEARYQGQVWEIEIPLDNIQINQVEGLKAFIDRFHNMHRDIFAIDDPGSEIECISWNVRVRCFDSRKHKTLGRLTPSYKMHESSLFRDVYFSNGGVQSLQVLNFDKLNIGKSQEGPAIIESPFTTVVIDPECTFARVSDGSLVIDVPKMENSND